MRARDLVVVGVVLALDGAGMACAHDIYKDLRSPQGALCCGGDPRTGDCEPVAYTLLPSGDVEMFSRRYNARIHVARRRITWAAIPGSHVEAHWCGQRRISYFGTRPEPPPMIYPPEEGDPDFVTFCAFIDPGGS
jgi:hypothetical protein